MVKTTTLAFQIYCFLFLAAEGSFADSAESSTGADRLISALAEEDECLDAGTAGAADTSSDKGCALQALQIKAGRTSVKAHGNSRTSQEDSSDALKEVGEEAMHSLRFGDDLFDHHDYRTDAANWLDNVMKEVETTTRAAKDRGESAAMIEQRKQEQLERHCQGLQKMSLSEVEKRWKEFPTEKGDDENMTQTRKVFASALAGGKPVVVKKALSALGWAAQEKWTREGITQRLHGTPLLADTFTTPQWIASAEYIGEKAAKYGDDFFKGVQREESIDTYLSLNHSSKNVFLFISEDWNLHISNKTQASRYEKAADILREDMLPHPSFAFAPESKRAILAIDGIGSSHGFHSHEPVWQVQVKGYKMWYLLPPSYPVSLRNKKGEISYSATVLIDGKKDYHSNACAYLQRAEPPPGTISCLVAPGDMMILPDAWLHSTCGLETYTAAAGGWLSPFDHAAK
eukprot:TRINITY_DN13067_c0_g2_i1.p1 TRINITY_DN13067_c0_g2~~TRINITY_DN13067_c0_g2_i1.p1  ORF type:complete len:458 (+),score=104.46 TRINITY_DN13067_c0_g2_i1:142-1515(+)